ncbi:MAG: hypothetical protein ACLFRT_13075 [Actinomycetota bacterium]
MARRCGGSAHSCGLCFHCGRTEHVVLFIAGPERVQHHHEFTGHNRQPEGNHHNHFRTNHNDVNSSTT